MMLSHGLMSCCASSMCRSRPSYLVTIPKSQSSSFMCDTCDLTSWEKVNAVARRRARMRTASMAMSYLRPRAFQVCTLYTTFETTYARTKLLLREASSFSLKMIFGVIAVRAAAPGCPFCFTCGTILPLCCYKCASPQEFRLPDHSQEGSGGAMRLSHLHDSVMRSFCVKLGRIRSHVDATSFSIALLPVDLKSVATDMCHRRLQRFLKSTCPMRSDDTTQEGTVFGHRRMVLPRSMSSQRRISWSHPSLSFNVSFATERS